MKGGYFENILRSLTWDQNNSSNSPADIAGNADVRMIARYRLYRINESVDDGERQEGCGRSDDEDQLNICRMKQNNQNNDHNAQ